MVKCFFYLVTSGISQLNKAGHEEIHQWALQSPDRVYAIGVDGHPDVSAYIRIKAGNSKAGRGTYKRFPCRSSTCGSRPMMTHWGFCLVRLICWIP